MNRRLFVSLLFGFFVVTSFITVSPVLAEKKKLSLGNIARLTVNGKSTVCASFNGRTYRVAKRVRGRGSVYKSIRGNSAQRLACSSLGALGSVTLNSLPDTSGLIAENTAASNLSISSISGTPPVLTDIPSLDVSTLFWRPGIVSSLVSGSPTADQCTEFLDPSADGESSGFSGCYLVQNTGYSFQNLLTSGTTLCYMKGVPTQANLDSGVLELVSGSFPNGDVTELFSAPSGSTPRVIKITANSLSGSGTVYLRISPTNTNVANGDSYRYEFWSCGGSPTVTDYEVGRVRATGEYHITSASNNGQLFVGSVSGDLRRIGDALVFDTMRTRHAEINFQQSGVLGKSIVEIDGANAVRTTSYDNFSGEIRKAFAVSLISGSSVSELRFLEGAYKEHYSGAYGTSDRANGVEFRTSYYAQAPSNGYVSELSAIDFNSNPFFASLAAPTYDSSGYSCSAVPDIELSIDLTAPQFSPVLAQCEGSRLDGMDFCNANADVQSAYGNYSTACMH